MFLFSLFSINIFLFVNRGLQSCLREETKSGIKVIWHQSPEASNVESDPKCYYNNTLITRNCTSNGWIPTLQQIRPCYKVVKHINTLKCPPGFSSISDKIDKYCFKVGTPSAWKYPCVESGGATAISELTQIEVESLVASLKTTEYKTFWLPARRQKNFSPVLWQIPGPNWGQLVSVNGYLPFKTSLLKNCLLFDRVKKILVTEVCSERHASLCLYINDLNYSAKCSKEYYAFKHILDEGKCFGIEQSDKNLSYYEFLDTKCKSPMGTNDNLDLKRLIFSKTAEMNNLPNNLWCWFSSFSDISEYTNVSLIGNDRQALLFTEHENNTSMKSIINNLGITALLNSTKRLPCMACEENIIYDETELIFEYNPNERKLFLTVYSPSGLFRYNKNDKGIQCFSDAKGFFKVINVYESIPVVKDKSVSISERIDTERSLFVIDLVTDRSARYWCEGHTKNLSLIATKKIVVNPHGKKIHVFSLVLKMYILLCDIDNGIQFELDELIENVTGIFKAEKVLIMDVLDYTSNILKVVLHIHLPINDTDQHESRSIVNSYKYLKMKVDEVFPDYNYTFVNLSSSIYCLPTMSQDSIALLWDLTPIGHIASPKQFCLQSNGLPVNRNCHGSYLLGGFWGSVNGKCDINYEPSLTTTLLFNFVNGKMSNDFTSRFLTTGLELIFNDTNIIIPADIYYLSKSFQNILSFANENATSIEIGDIDNIAWIMDRLMVLDEESLHLAQTLNSTNAILDSMNNFIAMVTKHKLTSTYRELMDANDYRIAIQPRFIVQVSYLKTSNVTGLAIINTDNSDKFTEMKILPLYMNNTLKDVISMKNLEVATWIPRHALKHIEKNLKVTNNTNAFKEIEIVINVYYNDIIFQELSTNHYIINSRIIEVTVPGFSTNIEFSIPLIFRQMNQTVLPKVCGYWDFHSDLGDIPGAWSKNGCVLLTSIQNLIICECYHLTHFGQLISINNNKDSIEPTRGEQHRKALNIITLIGSSLSLLGIVGIWTTAIVFDTWRKKAGTKVLLQLSVSIALPLILIILFNVDNSIVVESHGMFEIATGMKTICIILGSLFHYSILANFNWMLITAILQFIRYVRVLGVSRPSRFLMKVTFIGWGVPIIPVSIILSIDSENYLPNASIRRTICYPSGIYMIIGVVVPICIILIINIILFLLVIKAISKKSELRITDRSLVSAQFRLSVFLFFLLGLTWIFGIMSFSGSVFCSYLFCLTATIQGFVLFVYFIICDPTTRNSWITIMKPHFLSSRNSITTISNGKHVNEISTLSN